MKNAIPIYNLEQYDVDQESSKEILYSDENSASLRDMIDKPYRSNYYGLGLCVSGSATLTGNLNDYPITPQSIITMSPQVIKKWNYISDDFNTLSILFTKSFFTKIFSNQNHFDQFQFFDQNAKHVNIFPEVEIPPIHELFEKIKELITQEHPYKNEIIASYINILLFEYQKRIEKLDAQNDSQLTRNQQIVKDFKDLVNIHFQKERSVKFYAEKLFISPKYLTEIVKTETGKTSNEWIDEMLLLESKILLSNPSLRVSEIAQMLHFSDASTFGKFFKNLSGTSPLNYRKNQ